MCRIGRDRVVLGHTHQEGDVLLPQVLHQEQLDGLTLAVAQENSGRIEGLDIEQGVGRPTGAIDGVHPFRRVKRPEGQQVLEQRPQNTPGHLQQTTHPSL